MLPLIFMLAIKQATSANDESVPCDTELTEACNAIDPFLLQQGISMHGRGKSERERERVLQAKLSLTGGMAETEKESLPVLTPLARSLTSEDPEAAAEYMARYYGGRKVSTNTTEKCSQAVGVELAGFGDTPKDKYTVYFVKDTRKWAGMLPRGHFEKVADKAYHDMITSGKDSDFQAWMDFHDGIDARLLSNPPNKELLYKDHVNIQKNARSDHVSLTNTGSMAFRDNMPNTTQVIEFWSGWNQTEMSAGEDSYLQSLQVQESRCRDDVFIQQPSPWYKATYSVEASQLGAAYDFAKAALGVHGVDSPFPWPKKEQCQAARWSEFRDNTNDTTFNFHLVSSSSPFPDRGASEYHKYLGAIRNLESGCFDHYLYNSLILWSESLDPFVRRLQQLDTPFLALKLQDQLFSVVFSFPMSPGIVIDIRSSKLSEVVPEHFDECAYTRCAGSSTDPVLLQHSSSVYGQEGLL